MVKNYKDLNVWQKSIDFADRIYDVTLKFPREELYGLSSQLRRAAVSIPSNIAEGSGRQGTKEFLHFLGIARGSLAEIETQLILAYKRKFLENQDYVLLMKLSEDISKMLQGLRQSLKNKSQTTNH